MGNIHQRAQGPQVWELALGLPGQWAPQLLALPAQAPPRSSAPTLVLSGNYAKQQLIGTEDGHLTKTGPIRFFYPRNFGLGCHSFHLNGCSFQLNGALMG